MAKHTDTVQKSKSFPSCSPLSINPSAFIPKFVELKFRELFLTLRKLLLIRWRTEDTKVTLISNSLNYLLDDSFGFKNTVKWGIVSTIRSHFDFLYPKLWMGFLMKYLSVRFMNLLFTLSSQEQININTKFKKGEIQSNTFLNFDPKIKIHCDAVF